jgi:uncharacterized membrane protein YhhN
MTLYLCICQVIVCTKEYTTSKDRPGMMAVINVADVTMFLLATTHAQKGTVSVCLFVSFELGKCYRI